MRGKSKIKLGVLVSGNGTNLQAIIDAIEAESLGAEICIVVSDQRDACALKRAAAHKITTDLIERENFSSKKDFENAIVDALHKNNVELVCLAGFMRILGGTLLSAYKDRIVNIHPALLPAFPGLDAQKQAWEYGVKISGCTVHFVDDKTDHGPIICQAAVPVSEEDTPETLKNKILKEEHRIYPMAIQMIADERVKIEGRKVSIKSSSKGE